MKMEFSLMRNWKANKLLIVYELMISRIDQTDSFANFKTPKNFLVRSFKES